MVKKVVCAISIMCCAGAWSACTPNNAENVAKVALKTPAAGRIGAKAMQELGEEAPTLERLLNSAAQTRHLPVTKTENDASIILRDFPDLFSKVVLPSAIEASGARIASQIHTIADHEELTGAEREVINAAADMLDSDVTFTPVGAMGRMMGAISRIRPDSKIDLKRGTITLFSDATGREVMTIPVYAYTVAAAAGCGALDCLSRE